MLAWGWDWLVWLAWYGVLCGGWVGFWHARRRARQLDRELSVMAHAWRHAANKKG